MCALVHFPISKCLDILSVQYGSCSQYLVILHDCRITSPLSWDSTNDTSKHCSSHLLSPSKQTACLPTSCAKHLIHSKARYQSHLQHLFQWTKHITDAIHFHTIKEGKNIILVVDIIFIMVLVVDIGFCFAVGGGFPWAIVRWTPWMWLLRSGPDY